MPDDHFVRAGQIALSQNDIHVFKFAQRHVTISLRGEHRPFIRSRFDSLFAE